jgi:signal transduction histidine kinase
MPGDAGQSEGVNGARDRGSPRGLLASMRIRKKLIFLHTVFSILLTSVLLISVRPALTHAVAEAEGAVASRAVRALMVGDDPGEIADLIETRRGTASDLGFPQRVIPRLADAGDEPVRVPGETDRTWRGVVVEDGVEPEILVVGARLESARRAVLGVYILIIVALVAVYALIAVSLEVFVLPRHVYGPIRLLLAADRAVQRGDASAELVDERSIPADEMGEIMRSRNDAIRGIRRQETALAGALDELETVAADLKRKNHLLETAKRNLEGADRLMSLGMMSAGIAHELNTPLAVAKGLVERLRADEQRSLTPSQAELLGRVIGRLERLSEGLLDFARAREPAYAEAALAPIVDEAITLVRLDRESSEIAIGHDIDPGLRLECDADRMVQVFVNLIRNAVDALRGSDKAGAGSRDAVAHEIAVSAEVETRDGEDWVTIRVADTGPGIDPEMISTLFEPFVSSRLDSKGTGLGLAVSEGIVREHAGTLIARNRQGVGGAVFEIVMPRRAPRNGNGNGLAADEPDSGGARAGRADSLAGEGSGDG